ncbi:MAG TPA: hypothetical protein VNH83_26885 [Bryobacteraceae bacterium]|nr:hypothetical protein [Bryobacteraceae bacterium]
MNLKSTLGRWLATLVGPFLSSCEGKPLKPVSLLCTTGVNGAAARLTNDASIAANAMAIQPFLGTGPWYVCSSADANATTGVGILAILLTRDSVFTAPQSQNGLNQLALCNYYILGTVTGDSVIASYWIA